MLYVYDGKRVGRGERRKRGEGEGRRERLKDLEGWKFEGYKTMAGLYKFQPV